MRNNSILSKAAQRLFGKRYARQRPATVKRFEVLCDPYLDTDENDDSMRPRSYSNTTKAPIWLLRLLQFRFFCSESSLRPLSVEITIRKKMPQATRRPHCRSLSRRRQKRAIAAAAEEIRGDRERSPARWPGVIFNADGSITSDGERIGTGTWLPPSMLPYQAKQDRVAEEIRLERVEQCEHRGGEAGDVQCRLPRDHGGAHTDWLPGDDL